MAQIILHLDMNSYFASVEQQANPRLRGRPVGVCEHLGGIIIAPSVEAKRLGIRVGMPVWEALRVCPHIVLLSTDPSKYRAVGERFEKILRDYANDVERYSIDEAFIDISKYCAGDWDDALLLGLQIKQRLRREVGEWVSCSIGIGPNKLIAKIAADLGEGDIDRICVVRPEEIASLYDRLQLADIPGIGRRLERALRKLGIYNLRQLRDYPLENLLNQFGIGGWVLHRLGNLNSSQPPLWKRGGVAPSLLQREGRGEFFSIDLPKSIGHAYTLPRIISSEKQVRGLMMKLAEKVGRRMRLYGARGGVISYFHSGPTPTSSPPILGGEREGVFHKQKKLGEFINGGREIYRAAWEIFKVHKGDKQIKIMGVTMSGLTFGKPPEPLMSEYKKPRLLVSAADKINDKYGDWTIYPGRILGVPEEWGRDTVGMSRMR